MTEQDKAKLVMLLTESRRLIRRAEELDAKPWPVNWWYNAESMELYRAAERKLIEVGELTGQPFERILRSAPMPGHPLLWWLVQHVIGVWNMWTTVDLLAKGRYGWAAFSAFTVLITLRWVTAPLRLAIKGKWYDDE